jgi:quinolinate synthase
LNSSAEVKAESDICCTAENAGAVVNSLGDGREIMFVPDQYLGEFVARQTGRNLILWPGYCPTHSKIMPEDITRLKADHPAAKVVVHPECSPATRALADAVLNTGDIVRFARETDASEVIVGTDTGILHRLRKENPGKAFFPASELARCGKMKLTTLENILWSLEDMTNRIQVRGETLTKAKRAVDRMLEVAGYAQGKRPPGA